ncbi:MAG: transporter [Deltaproteobacteria bacterium]|nr:transporter [Deltaproteobacteria bacterium]
MHKFDTFILCGLLSLNLPAALHAESGPLGWGDPEIKQEMETDRPDFTEGTQPISPGHLQIETGYTYTYDGGGGQRLEEHTLPELLARIGAFEELELRIAWAGYISQQHGAIDESGVSDFSLGFKHRVLNQDDWMPDLSYIGELSIPAGSSGLTSGAVEPAFKLLWAYGLDRYSVAGNLNLAALQGEDERYLEVSSSLAFGADLTQHFGTYVEYFGLYPAEQVVEEDEHYLNGGFTWSVSPDFQLDLRTGFGLNGDAIDLFTGAGFAARI